MRQSAAARETPPRHSPYVFAVSQFGTDSATDASTAMATIVTATALDRYRASLGRVEVLDAGTERELAQQLGGRRPSGRGSFDRIELAVRHLHRARVPALGCSTRRFGSAGQPRTVEGGMAKFDPAKNCRLITYAAYWIRAEIRDYVVRSYRIVRLGTTRTERRAMRAFRRKAFESPQALAEESGMPLTRAKQLWPLLTRGDLSLDASVSDAPTAMERMSYKQPTPEECCCPLRVGTPGPPRAADAAMESLTTRERRIVEGAHPFGGALYTPIARAGDGCQQGARPAARSQGSREAP